jgi:hypothetical protein
MEYILELVLMWPITIGLIYILYKGIKKLVAEVAEERVKKAREAQEAGYRQEEQERLRSEETRRKSEQDARNRHEHSRTEGESSDQTRAEEENRARNREQRYASILGLRGRVTQEDLRKRYRELAAKYHPDKVAHLGPKLQDLARDEMQKINEAYSYFRERHGA